MLGYGTLVAISTDHPDGSEVLKPLPPHRAWVIDWLTSDRVIGKETLPQLSVKHVLGVFNMLMKRVIGVLNMIV